MLRELILGLFHAITEGFVLLLTGQSFFEIEGDQLLFLTGFEPIHAFAQVIEFGEVFLALIAGIAQ